MANAQRGEVELVVADRRYRLCLTLGALAELEARPVSRLSTGELVRLLTLLARGGGHVLDEADVAAWPLAPEAAADAVARCLQAGGE
ncbi:GTA-gp10 family protein [Maricaulis sp.]|uniref:GTA-gp10 family protein n=1 Tax=Maricaulis sp. TaxID=1486257 RepID=UPI00262B803B|nr:GTA-gp10 family protein [Maricaulis sp.]